MRLTHLILPILVGRPGLFISVIASLADVTCGSGGEGSVIDRIRLLAESFCGKICVLVFVTLLLH